MSAWMLVAGDFTPLGGMDAANHALACRLAEREDVHLVAHRIWPDLAALPRVRFHAVPRPFGRHALGAPLLARAGRRLWRELAPQGARLVVNGGNCPLPGANWVHYLHAAYTPPVAGSLARRAFAARTRRRDRADEHEALHQARLVICNSRRTRDDVVARSGVDPSRTRVIYYGSDPDRFALAAAPEREAARRLVEAAEGRRLAGFIGALGDRRKAFDTVFRAWTTLCADARWDVDLLVIGTGAELPDWQRRAQAAGLDGRLRFLGFRRDVPRLLAALDVLVHPARYEAYGLSVHEAWCRGVPALVSARAGVAERYPPELDGLLIRDPDDAGELVRRLQCWRAGADGFARAAERLSAMLLARTWNTMADEIIACVERAL
jgi:glycosyltransferase involved in cell wall biosynthesis